MQRSVPISLVVSLVVLGAAAAHAGPPPKTRKPGTVIPIDPSLSDRAKPKAPGDEQPARPTLTPEDLLAIQRDASDIRQQQIDLLEKLVAETPDSLADEKADLYFRLAEAYAQRSRFHRLEGTGAAIDADRAAKPADKKRLLAEAADHQKASRSALINAIKAYKALVDNPAFDDFADLDKAIFYYGHSLAEATYADDARKVYHRLLTDFPQSPFAPEAYLAFADYYFAAGQLPNARAFYGKVLAFPSSKVYSYANYMLGWVHLNEQAPVEAGRQFLQVVRDTAGVKGQETLHRAATKDFVRAYAEFGQVQKALAAFTKLDEATAPAMYELLADLYVEQGKNDRAIHAYRELIKTRPADPHVCLWQYDVTRAIQATPATVGQRVDEIVRLAKLHTALAAKKALPAADASECRDNAQAMACEMARALHSEAQRTKNPETLAHADTLYGACIDAFPDADDVGETQYFRAELRWSRAEAEGVARDQARRWEEAATAFSAVVDARQVDAKLLKESARAAVLAWQNVLAAEGKVDAKAVATSEDLDEDQPVPAPEPLSAREERLVAAFAAYRASVTDQDDDERVATLFLEANVLRKHYQFDRARPLLAEVLREHPGHETALYAANVLLNIEIATHRRAALREWTTWFRAHPAFYTARADQDRTVLAARVADIDGKVVRMELQDLEKEARRTGDLDTFVRCGSGYLALFNDTVKANPDAGVAEKVDEVLYNAGVCFEEGRSLSAAISAYQELRDRFPDSPTAAKALARLGAVYARVAYYREVSTMFEEYAKRYAGQADAYQAMNDAVFYRRGLGDDVKAIENTKYFIAKFGGKQQGDAANAFFSIATILEKRGDQGAVVKHYRDYLARYGEKGGVDKAVVAYARIGQILWEESCPVKTVDGSCIEVARTRAVRSAATRRGHDATRTRCGDETKAQVTPIARDGRKVKAALAAFAEAVKVYERAGGAIAGDANAARHAYALARFHQAEVDLEAYLKVDFPTGLDFDPRKPAAKKKSDERLAAWIAAKSALGKKSTAAYGALVHDVKDPTTAIAAAARAGQVSQHFADALYTAEIPAFIRPYEEAVDAYCDTLTKLAEPYEETALDGFGACLKASSDLGWFSSWSRLCERELGQISPDKFPTSSELWAAPDETTAKADVEGAIARLE